MHGARPRVIDHAHCRYIHLDRDLPSQKEDASVLIQHLARAIQGSSDATGIRQAPGRQHGPKCCAASGHRQLARQVGLAQSRLASREQLDLIQRQQDLGEPITPPFIQVKLQAQETLANEAREEAAAIANYNIAIQRLERAKGTLLKYNNVKIKEDAGTRYLNRAWVDEATKQ